VRRETQGEGSGRGGEGGRRAHTGRSNPSPNGEEIPAIHSWEVSGSQRELGSRKGFAGWCREDNLSGRCRPSLRGFGARGGPSGRRQARCFRRLKQAAAG